jgi:glycosyltransferase involved in cell wall biosynthesis
LKIGIDCRCLEGEKTGVGVYLSNLMQHILESANQPMCFICYFWGKPPSLPWMKGPRIKKRIIKPIVQNNFFWSTFQLPFYLAKDKVDILHAPSYTTPFIKTRKTIVTIHDISYAVNPAWYSYKSDIIRRRYYYQSAKSADIILTVSEFSKNEIIKYYQINPEKVIVTYHGLDKKFLQNLDDNTVQNILKKYHIDGDYVLYVGSIHPRRNIERLIEAFIKLKNEYERFHTLKLVLTGKDEGSLKKLLLLYGKRNDLIFTGYVPEEDIILFYKRAKCFTFLSFYEGFGFPILESMASGIPTLISDIQVFREIFKDNSLLVDPYDVDKIKNCLFRILTDEYLRNTLSRKSKEYATSFLWKTTAKKTLDAYKDLLYLYH